ncbi:BatA domain-containing protein [uncultured Tenacibaculum sp.]|uniref:BatA domain-containing protein n=1 Tax=uncultured Tenacibaculum sp. TaxID=174713 RepID=UPI002637C26B|nr:BatA domain-containing protein [uncultured Tenacibaculum sp.]
MQFKHPEILYFLFLLLIPILVHLFQLRKFKKVAFTNVAFLENLVIKNRKSSQLKKWLILCTRLLLISAIVLAFAQPFFSNQKANTENHVAIYLDNSLSTNAKGAKGNLLKIAAQDIIDKTSDNATYSLVTNDNVHYKISETELKKILLNIKNTVSNLSINDVLLKLSNLNNTTENLLISDFQNINKDGFSSANLPLTIAQILPERKDNIAIDSVYISTDANAKNVVNINVKNQGNKKENVPIAIYNGDKLISKQTFSIEKNAQKSVPFAIENMNDFSGVVKVDFNDTFAFDNQFFFSINTNEKINVLAIGENNDFLARIYTDDEFNFVSSAIKNINYNNINQQQLILLNEVDKIPESLHKSLLDYAKSGGNLVIIPNEKSQFKSYNTLLQGLNVGKLLSKKVDSLKITKINFNHPLFKNVFDKRVKNFQYPSTNTFFNTKLNNASTIVSFENEESFIQQIALSNANVFWFASPLNKNNSNFTNSPLIVPVFYNIAKQSLKLSKLYYTLGQQNTIEIPTRLQKDDILTIKNEQSSFIPLQQTLQTKVRLITKELPNQNGFYTISKGNSKINTIAFNNPASESSLEYLNLNTIDNSKENIVISNSLKDGFNKIDNKYKVHWIWKWFLILAIVSLLLEILILKYFKV